MRKRMNHQVNRCNEKDERQINRLSSFLCQKGELDCKTIQPIKSNVFFILTPNGNRYILKRHGNRNVLEQQWHFLEQLQCPVAVSFVRFPNLKKYLKHNRSFWTISPFMEGKPLHYANQHDRKQSIEVLRRFHKDAKPVTIRYPLQRKRFYWRWADRLKAFKETEDHFRRHGFTPLFQDIVKQTEIQLYHVSQLSWSRLEQNARKKGEWAHGDVAEHNFIHGRKTRIIDFDLLSSAPILYDYIQLGQRFLPYISWDIDKLLAYQMVPGNELIYWLRALLVPSDVMREWLHLLKNDEGSGKIRSHLERMEADWIKRQYFFKRASIMLKS